jgi:hypothetical protein
MMKQARTATLARRVRSVGGRLIRRLGLLPGGVPDGLGEDEQLVGTTFAQEVLVFFGDTRDSLYQIEQWYGPLRALDEVRGVVVFCMDSRTAAAIRTDSGLRVHVVSQDATLDDLLARGAFKLCLYVNHNPLNFGVLRFRSVLHVSLLHGDSDKAVSISNQVKAYDYTFVAGQAGIDRFRDYTTLFDATSRCIAVGRPQLDLAPGTGRGVPSAGELPTVLYAPTWEGGQDSVAYGSSDTHGPALVASLLAGGYRVIYRPHPLAGVRLGSYGEADRRIRDLLTDEAASGAGHRVSVGGPIVADFAEADLLIADVSAVTNDWLPTHKPVIVTLPAKGRARAAATRLLSLVPRLSVADAAAAADLVRHHLDSDPTREEREALVSYYFGDISPGASLARFLDACTDVMATRDREWARVEAIETD